MTDRKAGQPAGRQGKPEIAAQKRLVKLAPAIGDWTTYKPTQVLLKKVKTGLYGFDRLSKEELNLALNIHYRFVELLIKSLKIDLKMAVELFTVSMEQTNYLNFLRTFSSPVVQARMLLPDMHDSVALIFDLSAANSILNYALGSRDLDAINRGLTDAENIAFRAALNQYLSGYSSAFADTVAKPDLSIIGSPDIALDSAVSTSATFVAFCAEITLADNQPAKIVLGYPGGHLKSLLARYQARDKQKPLDFSGLSPALLAKIAAPIRVTLGKTVLTTSEMRQLEAGDVVALDALINEAVPLEIGEKFILFGQPGLQDNRTAIRLASVKSEEAAKIAPPAIVETEEKLPALPLPPGPKPIAPTLAPKPPLPTPAPAKAPAPPAPKKDIFSDDFDEDFLDEAEDDFDLDDDDLLDEET